MFNPLSDQDLAKLHAKFVVPIVIDQMLKDEEPLDDVAEHAMIEIFTELCPDTALLCLAMCAQHIARDTHHLPVGKALGMEAEKIVEEYGPHWLAHEANPDNLDNSAVVDLLVHIPEDLECLRDLLEATMGELEEDHSIAAILCDILSLQADYQRDMAEIELQQLNLAPQSRPVLEVVESSGGDNVIAFPFSAKQRRQMARQ